MDRSNSSIRESINLRESMVTIVNTNSIGPEHKQPPNPNRKSNALHPQPQSRNSNQGPLLKQTSNKDLKKQTVSNKSPDRNFMKVYEENMGLKQRQTELLKQIKDLKERLNKRQQHSRSAVENQLKNLATGKKSEWDTVKQPFNRKATAQRGSSGPKGTTSNKVQHLLQIIDHYKAKLMTAEEEILNVKRQKSLLEQDLKLKDRKHETGNDDKPQHLEEQFNLNQKLRRSIRELQLEKERNKFTELSIKSMQAKMRNLQLKLQDFDNLKVQNRSLEQKLVRMTQLPNFDNVVDKADEERKAKELQAKLKLLNDKYNSLKDSHLKQEAELKLLQNKLIEMTHEINELEKDNQKLKSQSISNPVLQRLNNNPDLLMRIITEIQRQKRKPEETMSSKAQVEKLILEKEELARQMLNYQAKLQHMEQNYKERERISKLQKQQEAISIINQPKVTTRQGALYDGDVTAFTDQSTNNIPAGTNYFDLFLGEVNLLETMVQSVTGLSNSSSPLVMATVDFYNHNTEHSKLTQGCRCDMQSQFYFRINEDDFFLKYLQKGTFQVDLWASEGNKNFHLGRANIELKHLVTRSRPRISAVVSTAIPLYLSQKVMGSLNLVMRMRLPIYDQLQRLRELGSNIPENQDQVITRKLVIQIQQGRGFGEKSNAFVYFPFRMEDYYTRAIKGSTPNWDYLKLLEINYDNDFKNYLRKSELEFTVFDDSVVIQDERNSDVVGSAVLSLLPLLEGKPIRQRLQLRKGNQKRGTIDVKIYWHQSDEDKQNDPREAEEKKMMSVGGVHEDIRNFMRENSVTPEKVYRMIDDNRSGLISYEQLIQWISKIAVRKYTPDVLNSYYKGFRQPLNLTNFVTRISQEVDISPPVEAPLVVGIGKINEFLKINSTQIKQKTLSLEQFLAGKNMVELAGQITTNRQGYVTRAVLQDFLVKNGVEIQIEEERVRLLDFLRKKQNIKQTV